MSIIDRLKPSLYRSQILKFKTSQEEIDTMMEPFSQDLIAFFAVLFEEVMGTVGEGKSIEGIIKEIDKILGG